MGWFQQKTKPPSPPAPPTAIRLDQTTADWEIGGDDCGYISFRATDGKRYRKVQVYGLEHGFRDEVLKACLAGVRRRYNDEQPKETTVPTPYIGYSNETLNKLPQMKDGESIVCPHCWKSHDVSGTGGTYFYVCGDKTYLAGVNGRNVVNVKPDVAGSV